MTNEASESGIFDHDFGRELHRIVSKLVGVIGPRHLQLAEDAVQESMLRAVQLWPFHGVPEKPGAWLLRVAQNFAISTLRRNRIFEEKSEELIARLDSRSVLLHDLYGDQVFHDDEVRLMFLCCHSKLNANARVALSLKLMAGFSVGDIARLFFAPEATIAQRLVRAKKLFREQAPPLELPASDFLRERLASVLDTIYLMFTAGYTARSGEELIGKEACLEALRLARLLADSSISDPRADALAALLCLQAARFPARTSAGGGLVPLEEQDQALWTPELIEEGFLYFGRSIAGKELSTWHVQAAIAAIYARSATSGTIDWHSILVEYDLLVTMTDSPVVLLNRAVVISRVYGPAAGLTAIEPLEDQAVFDRYFLLPAVRGQMLLELGKFSQAEAAFLAALECTCSEPERQFIQSLLALSRRNLVSQPLALGDVHSAVCGLDANGRTTRAEIE